MLYVLILQRIDVAPACRMNQRLRRQDGPLSIKASKDPSVWQMAFLKSAWLLEANQPESVKIAQCRVVDLPHHGCLMIGLIPATTAATDPSLTVADGKFPDQCGFGGNGLVNWKGMSSKKPTGLEFCIGDQITMVLDGRGKQPILRILINEVPRLAVNFEPLQASDPTFAQPAQYFVHPAVALLGWPDATVEKQTQVELLVDCVSVSDLPSGWDSRPL